MLNPKQFSNFFLVSLFQWATASPDSDVLFPKIDEVGLKQNCKWQFPKNVVHCPACPFRQQEYLNRRPCWR